ncbi:UDP-N-acetylmuramate--L-alanine ligase [Jatrophihabitans sp.]|uniref:UDP-N-acetylmuramate--L-alanine ligase n=1 Tax=Jatrophihabitans sp. TaxID=1932789 RepID=UPI002BAF9B10|nr:UDP-N-acetylmuramate--L-alanine ligase [Jatrophihabitans sp.]
MASAATEVVPPAADLGRVHVMGIAGSGMSALARILLARGVAVTGCESRESATVAQLRELGAEIRIGHALEHLDGTDTLVYTTAIDPENFELVAGRERGLRVLRRATALAAMIAGHRCVAIAGTHGKTTTTSLLTTAALAAGLDPSFAIGANLAGTGTNGQAGGGELFLVEADESDGSFLLLWPEIAVLTNVEADHLESHGDLEGVFRAFEQFVDRIAEGGRLFYCADDAGARRIAGYARGRGVRVIGYGTGPEADIRVSDIRELPDAVEFTVHRPGRTPTDVRVGSLVGRHMALNATAALAVAEELGVPAEQAVAGWRNFGGVQRRFEFHGEAAGVRVYDDYAHHPTEVAAQLAAARGVLAGTGRLIAIFQPGTYSRTQTFAAEFGEAMALADIAVVMDIFPARERPIPGVTGELIAREIPLPAGQVVYEPDWHAVAARVAALARPGDLLLTMGIGDVHLLCADLLTELAELAARGGPEASA